MQLGFFTIKKSFAQKQCLRERNTEHVFLIIYKMTLKPFSIKFIYTAQSESY